MRASIVGMMLICVSSPLGAFQAAAAEGSPGRLGVRIGNIEVEARRAAKAGHMVRGSDLMGLKVINRENEALGKVEDVVVDCESGKIRYAVVSFGGFLGLGDKFFAVPWSAVEVVSKTTTGAGTEPEQEPHVVLPVRKDDLQSAPGFDKGHWPDFGDAKWAAEVDHYYSSYTPKQARRAGGRPR